VPFLFNLLEKITGLDHGMPQLMGRSGFGALKSAQSRRLLFNMVT
jgi:hypothetical protein